MTYLGLLDKTATISRGTVSKSATKETTRTFAAIASGVTCSIQSRRGQIRKADAGVFKTMVWTGYWPPGTDIDEGDRVLDADGVLYEVVDLEVIRDRVVQTTLRQMTTVAS